MIKAVLMDLGKTILDNHVIDFTAGLRSLYHKSINPSLSLSAYLATAEKLNAETYLKKRANNQEMCIIDFLDNLNRLCFNLWPDFNNNADSYEDLFYAACEKNMVITGVIDFLNFLKVQKIPVIVVSNSTFTSRKLKAELDKHQLLSYFLEVYSSADLGFRKPSPIIFDKPFEKLKSVVVDLQPKDVCYIGDSWEFDVKSSQSFSLKPLWFTNSSEKTSVYQFNNYHQLIDDWFIL